MSLIGVNFSVLLSEDNPSMFEYKTNRVIKTKIKIITFSGKINNTLEPINAPIVVAEPKKNAILKSTRLDLMYFSEADAQVAIVENILIATAVLTFRPSIVSEGTTIIPPPKPKREPVKPANNPIRGNKKYKWVFYRGN